MQKTSSSMEMKLEEISAPDTGMRPPRKKVLNRNGEPFGQIERLASRSIPLESAQTERHGLGTSKAQVEEVEDVSTI